jgi:hypothetical protein
MGSYMSTEVKPDSTALPGAPLQTVATEVLLDAPVLDHANMAKLVELIPDGKMEVKPESPKRARPVYENTGDISEIKSLIDAPNVESSKFVVTMDLSNFAAVYKCPACDATFTILTLSRHAQTHKQQVEAMDVDHMAILNMIPGYIPKHLRGNGPAIAEHAARIDHVGLGDQIKEWEDEVKRAREFNGILEADEEVLLKLAMQESEEESKRADKKEVTATYVESQELPEHVNCD